MVKKNISNYHPHNRLNIKPPYQTACDMKKKNLLQNEQMNITEKKPDEFDNAKDTG